MSWFTVFTIINLPVVGFVVIARLSTFVDVSVFGVVIPVVVGVLDFAESVMCGDVDAGYSTLPEVSVVGSDCIIWRVVCCVVGASQSICKTCEGLVVLSEMLSCDDNV